MKDKFIKGRKVNVNQIKKLWIKSLDNFHRIMIILNYKK